MDEPQHVLPTRIFIPWFVLAAQNPQVLASGDVHRKYWPIWTHLPQIPRKLRMLETPNFFLGAGDLGVRRTSIWIFFLLKCDHQETFDSHRKEVYLVLFSINCFSKKKIIPAITSWNCLDFLAI